MSKLLEMLDRTTEAKTQPLGFGAALKEARAAPLVLLARLSEVDAALVGRAVGAGADALLMEVTHFQEETLAQATAGAGEVPWGVWLGSLSRGEGDRLAEMGCDFLVFRAQDTPASVLAEEELGKVLAIETSLGDGLARAVAHLAVDAILLAEEAGPLTVQRMMSYERLVGYTGKHLIVPLSASAEASDLEVLREAEVRGVMVDMAAEEAEEVLRRVKGWISELHPRKPKAREKMEVILPLLGGLAGEEPFEEEEF